MNLSKVPTLPENLPSKSKLKAELKTLRLELGDFQERLYAHGRHSVLVCLQGMDTSGKDSLVREVFKDFNARGVVVRSFKKPNEREYKHDFLWRYHRSLPEKGKFGVFNRSYYEDVLAVRVHPEFLLAEKLPHIHKLEDIPEDFWKIRLDRICKFEEHLAASGVLIFKFFLHISPQEQTRRLLRRLNRPHKRWKFSPDDLKARQYWEEYTEVYEKTIKATDKPHAPWHIIPADSKPASRLAVAKILQEKLSKLTHIQEPKWDKAAQGNIEEAIAILERDLDKGK